MLHRLNETDKAQMKHVQSSSTLMKESSFDESDLYRFDFFPLSSYQEEMVESERKMWI